MDSAVSTLQEDKLTLKPPSFVEPGRRRQTLVLHHGSEKVRKTFSELSISEMRLSSHFFLLAPWPLVRLNVNCHQSLGVVRRSLLRGGQCHRYKRHLRIHSKFSIYKAPNQLAFIAGIIRSLFTKLILSNRLCPSYI